MLKKIALRYIEKQFSHYEHQVMSLENVLEYENDIIDGSLYEKELLKEYERNSKLLNAYRVVLHNLKEEK